jgi:predicted peptidase
MIFLHGAGERGSDPALVTRHGPPKLVEAGAKFPFILASPQCRAGSNWNTDDLKAFFDFLLAEYNVDAKSVYLTGISMGGFATWNFASEHPEFFAAIAPVCGGGDYIRSHLLPPDRQEALKTLPVRTFHGDQDDVVPVSETVRMVEIFRRAGNRSVEFTVYPGVDHDSWTSAYATPGLFEWFAAQRRA